MKTTEQHNFLIQAIIKECKSLVKELEEDFLISVDTGGEFGEGYSDCVKKQIISLKQKIINAESKLKQI